jgi:hypothetical protein
MFYNFKLKDHQTFDVSIEFQIMVGARLTLLQSGYLEPHFETLI